MEQLDFHNTLLVCTGVPVELVDDSRLTHYILQPFSHRIIFGGTTAKVVARELGRDLTVELSLDPSGLPSISYMEGFDLVCEGVLTLMAFRKALQDGDFEHTQSWKGRLGTRYRVIELFWEAREIVIVEGRRLSDVHKLDNLPIRLANREELIRDIVSLLVDRYGKSVRHIRI